MIEKALDILGKILDSYFIPAIVSLTAAIGVYSLTSNDFWLLNKLGRELYIVLIFLILLILILLAKYIGVKIKKWLEKVVIRWDDAEKEEEFLFQLMDQLEPKDQRKVRFFLDNENKPLILIGNAQQYHYTNGFLLRYCDMQDFIAEDDTEVPLSEYDLSPMKGDFSKGYAGVRVKLKEDYYNGFKHLKNKTGKISRFD